MEIYWEDVIISVASDDAWMIFGSDFMVDCSVECLFGRF